VHPYFNMEPRLNALDGLRCWSVVWRTSNRAKVYVRHAMSTLFVEAPTRYGSVVTFQTIANVRDVYEVRASY